MFGLRIGGMGRVGSALTLTQQAINILRRPGLESHVYMPGVGWVNGVSAGNFSDTGGTTAAVVDSTAGIGLMVDASGDSPAINASQGTTANKPILRRGAVNRLFFSQDQSNANWGKSNTTVTAGAAAPDATTTAYTLNEDTATSTHDLTQARAITAGLAHTFSIYLKANGRTLVRVMITWNGVADRVHADFNLSNGTVGSAVITGTGVSTATPTITAVGDGWYRCTISGSCATGATLTGYVRAMQSAGVVSYTGSGASAYNVWGAQLETGSTASPYIPTTTAAASSTTGPYWAEYDGTDFLSLAAVPFQASDDSCVILAANHSDPSATSRGVFSINGAASQRASTIYTNNRFWRYRFVDDAATAYEVVSGSATEAGVTAVVTGRKVGATRILRVNGSQVGTNATPIGATTLTAAQIGAVSSAPSGQFLGGIYPVIAIKGTVTDADLAILERYVAQASGVTL